MRDIAEWLKQRPREVTITRQAVHSWLKARLRKLKKLHVDFAHTGVAAQFKEAVVDVQPLSFGDRGATRPISDVTSRGTHRSTPRTVNADRKLSHF